MKTTIIILSTCISVFAFSQTNIIAMKSHAGTIQNIGLEKDNFGEYYQPKVYIDSVIYVKPGVLVESKHSNDFQYYIDVDGKEQEYKQVQFYDTVFDSSITQKLTFSIQKKYPNSVVFVGFTEETLENVNPYFKGMQKNGGNTLLMFFELLIFLGFFRHYRLNHVR